MMPLPFKWQALSQCVPCGSASLACNWEASISFQLLTAQIDDVIWSLNMATLLKTRFSLRHWPWHLTLWRTSPLFDYHRLPIPRARHPCKLWGNLCLPPAVSNIIQSFHLLILSSSFPSLSTACPYTSVRVQLILPFWQLFGSKTAKVEMHPDHLLGPGGRGIPPSHKCVPPTFETVSLGRPNPFAQSSCISEIGREASSCETRKMELQAPEGNCLKANAKECRNPAWHILTRRLLQSRSKFTFDSLTNTSLTALLKHKSGLRLIDWRK